MNIREIGTAFSLNKKIYHPKGGVYRLIDRASMKVLGAWTECYTYVDLETNEVYVRASGDFIKFTVHK